MSLGVYALEPATNGKVLLKTTAGDIDIELWPKEAPKACRNFVQLCLEGYYDNTIFHRIVKDFIVQGGDPTGTGFGGDSVYGAPFPDEFHSRLRYRHRGMVGMANTGKNKNRSQFFMTLGSTPELDNKNTLFGKVTGNTIFNVLRLGESEVGEEERPLFPPRILSAEVLSNPFDDIIPRDLYALGIKKKPGESESAKQDAIERPQIRKKRNVALLSFGDEEGTVEEEEEVSFKPRMKSSHALLADTSSSEQRGTKSKDDDRSNTASSPSTKDSDGGSKKREEEQNEVPKDLSDRKRRRAHGSSDEEREQKEDKRQEGKSGKQRKKGDEGQDEGKQDSKWPPSAYEEVMGRRQREKEERRKEFRELKKSLLSFKKQASASLTTQQDTQKEKKDAVLDPLEEQKLRYKEKSKRRDSNRQKQTMEALKKFQESLKKPDKEWKQHVLQFEKIGGEMKQEEELYSVFDPLAGKEQKKKPSWHKQRLQRKEPPEKW